MSSEDRYVFLADWYDSQSSLVRKFYLSFYPHDQTIDIRAQYDIKNKRLFLKRLKYPSITEEELYVGATITVFSRQYKLAEYGDEFTKKAFDQQYHLEKSFAMIKPDQYVNIGKIIQIVEQSGFKISNLRMLKLSPPEAQEFYMSQRGQVGQDLVGYMSSDMVVGLDLVRENAISILQQVMGTTNPAIAKSQAPNTIRATFGKDTLRNAIHGSDSIDSFKRESNFFFSSIRKTTAMLNNCTCAIIKPHAIQTLNAIIK